MIRVCTSEPQTKKWKQWRKKCDEATQSLLEAVRAGNKPKISTLYKGQKEEHYFCSSGPFAGKCAYCEVFLKSNQYGDIDHYRPKGRVTKLDNSIVTYDLNGKVTKHPGYYWLAYDWRNLLPSCIRCNSMSKVDNRFVGKGTRFPVKNDQYAIRPGEETKEHPLLLNPIVDDPGDHLGFDNATGTIKSQSKRGEVTCEVLGLNEPDRCKNRKQCYDDTINTIIFWLMARLQNQSGPAAACQKIEEIRQGRSEYTLAGRAANSQFKRNIVEAMEDPLDLSLT